MGPLTLSVDAKSSSAASSDVSNKKIANLQLGTKNSFASVSMGEEKPLDFLRILFEGVIAGGTAGVVVETALYPIDTIKTRLQAARGGGKIILKGLYSGLAGNLAGVLPASALFVGVYEPTKQKLLKMLPDNLSAAAHLTAGAIGGLAASLIRVPTEVIKQRMQTGQFSSAPDAVRLIAAKEGFRGLYAGYGSFLLRDLPFDAIQFCIYEQLRLGYKAAVSSLPIRFHVYNYLDNIWFILLIIIKKVDADIVMLQETKIQHMKKELLMSIGCFRYRNWVSVDAEGRSGGILVVWKSRHWEGVESVVGKYSISVKFRVQNDFLWITSVYGPNKARERGDFWEELADLNGLCQPLWCVGGDFNAIRNPDEKLGGRVFTRTMRDFDKLICDLQLVDTEMRDAKFTWSNLGTPVASSRLDRFLMTKDWWERFPFIHQKAIPRLVSDHCPIILDAEKFKWGPMPFKFENMWLKHEKFRDVVNAEWNKEMDAGWPGFQFMNKLKNVKVKLKAWNKEVFGVIEEKKKHIVEGIQAIDILELTNDVSEEKIEERRILKGEFEDVLLKEEIKWKQKAKFFWAKEGDSNTAFFHKMVNARRNRNFISKIVREDGSSLETEEEIQLEITNFFQSLFQRDDKLAGGISGIEWGEIDSEAAANLERKFEIEEVREAIFSSDSDKSPGPDGFSMAFFKDRWELIKDDIMKVFEDFYEKGIVNGIVNETYICLIPKKKEAIKVKDYRPISLVTGVYKIIAKVLANRLRKVMEDCTSNNQFAFVGKRQIVDAILVANELIEECRKRKREGWVVKLDFEKAYDRVDWRFLIHVLKNKGFGERWRKWIKGCLVSVSFSVLINGRPRGKFGASRGLRQGDPLSPFLFVLCADVLSRLFHKAMSRGVCKGMKVGKGRLHISHLQFADDTILFTNGDELEVESMMKIVEFFCSSSGLKINLSKSLVLGINKNESSTRNLGRNLQCEIGNWPITYLGLPLGGNPKAESFWKELIVKMEKRLEGWKRGFLSRGGRLCLIQSVLSSLPVYYLSLFEMPKKVAKSVERKIKEFLWASGEDGRGWHLVNWEKVKDPKEGGGLEIGNISLKNKALLSKWLWRYPLEPNALWHLVIKSIYGEERGGWISKQPKHTTKRAPWKDIMKNYKDFLKCVKMEVGNGSNVAFWEDVWLLERPLKNAFPRLFRAAVQKDLVVADCGLIHNGRMVWNVVFSRNLNDWEVGEYEELMGLLANVKLNAGNSDKRVWVMDTSGCFSVKSCVKYWISIDNTSNLNFPAHVWKIKAPKKALMVCWLGLLGKLNTMDMLQKRMPKIAWNPHWCILCKASGESINHCFLHCWMATKLWNKFRRVAGFTGPIPRTISELFRERWVCFGGSKRGSVLKDIIMVAIIWVLWEERNHRIFEDKSMDWNSLWDKVEYLNSIWASISKEFSDFSFNSIRFNWEAIVCR